MIKHMQNIKSETTRIKCKQLLSRANLTFKWQCHFATKKQLCEIYREWFKINGALTEIILYYVIWRKFNEKRYSSISMAYSMHN